MRYLFFKIQLLLFVLCVMASCSDSNDEPTVQEPFLEITPSGGEEISSEGGKLTLTVKSNVDWEVTSDQYWCKVTAGDALTGNQTLNLEVEENLSQNSRQATLSFTYSATDGSHTSEVTVLQKGQEFVAGGTYKIPVVFHVLYSNRNMPTQYVREGHLQTVLDEVNKLYSECSQDLKLEFVMATVDPDGNLMEEPGVDRIPWASIPIDCEKFMSSSGDKYLDLIWNPDEYMNIMLYKFSNSAIAGIAQFPFLLAPDYLEGCEIWTGGALSQENLNRPQCISVNSDYVYNMVSLTPETPDGDDGCVAMTIAHELGHYLGLRHVFSESLWGCRDTDYCDDTPTYDRSAYEKLVATYLGTSNFKDYLDELIQRESCTDGSVFVSDNIMDYSISYSNKFTSDQAERIRYILEKGVFVPGPKNRTNETKSRSIGKLDLPMTIMK